MPESLETAIALGGRIAGWALLEVGVLLRRRLLALLGLRRRLNSVSCSGL